VSEPRALTLRALVLAVLAGGIARLVLTDAHLAYVQPSMRIPLLVSVVVIGVLAAASATRADRIREEQEERAAAAPHDHDQDQHEHDDHDHDGHRHRGHPALPGIGWWLVVPVVCIALVPIVPLGADAVGDRASNEVLGRTQVATGPADGGEVDQDAVDGGAVTLLDFVSRTVNDLTNPYPEPVTLVGFVTDDPTVPDGFVLARFVVSCCAADALPLLVRVDWAGQVPPRESWVEVTGEHVPAPAALPQSERPEVANIVLRATEVIPIPEPSQPYESI
jgi:uncharacterized repeat protein (TIGR03943 family)